MVATLPVSYTSVAMVIDVFPPIGSMSTVTSANIATNLGDAEAFINAKLSRTYALPFVATPPVLRGIATDIGVYYTITRRNMWTAEQLKQSTWPDRYAAAVEMLNELASGALPLVDDTGTLVEASTARAPILSTKSGYNQTFDEHGVYDQSQDTDKIDDLYNDRVNRT